MDRRKDTGVGTGTTISRGVVSYGRGKKERNLLTSNKWGGGGFGCVR